MTRFILASAIGVVLLSACLEAQPAPDLPLRPSTDFTLTTVADGFTKPWSVAELPDGGFLVTEIAGKLFRVSANGARAEISGLPEDIFVAGQGGLLVSPNFIGLIRPNPRLSILAGGSSLCRMGQSC